MTTCENMQAPHNYGSPRWAQDLKIILENREKKQPCSSSSQIRGRMIYHMQVLLQRYLQTLIDIEY